MKFRLESVKNRLKSYLCEIIKKIEITHRLDYDRYPIYLNDNIRLDSCKKEPDTIRWIESFNKQDIIFDIGANIGAYSLIMAKYARKVYAFEPSIFTFGILAKNLRTNRAMNVVPLNIALSGRRQLGLFEYSATNAGGSGHSFGKPLNANESVYRQEILSCTIDGFIADFNLEPPQHIKIDVDGNEYEILKGAETLLAGPSLKSILVEVDDPDKSEISPYLKGMGFSGKARYYLGSAKMYNCLFTKL